MSVGVIVTWIANVEAKFVCAGSTEADKETADPGVLRIRGVPAVAGS